RAVYFGDGCYEAVMTVNRRIYAADDHINRFFSSMKQLGIKPPWTKEELRAILDDIVSRLDSDIGKLYWQVSRGTGPRNHAFPKDAKANLLVFLTPGSLPDFHKEIKLVSVEDIRFEICNIKTLNLIPSVLATDAAMSAGCDEAVLHRGEIVTECAHSNISILKNGALITHPADNFILPGTVRKHMLDICYNESIPIIERPFTLDELRSCDEAVITASFSAIRRGISLDGKPIGGKAPDLLKLIQDDFAEELTGMME
ncbi:MAG: aminotransferase class IV, partial [Clostridia bacterium]|nr:aminotransferase class IV [Clostridia bacterium]